MSDFRFPSLRAIAAPVCLFVLGLLAATPVLAAPTISIADASIVEGNQGTQYLTFTISLSAANTVATRFNVATANGTATAGSDYTATSSTGLTIAAGGTSRTFLVPISGDLVNEANETFFVNLSNPVGGTIADAQAIGTITNDDTAGLPVITIADVSVLESDNFHGIMFWVALSKQSATQISLDLTTSDGTATGNSDYTPTTTHITIPPGDTGMYFQVMIQGDSNVEPNETFFVTASNVVGATVGDGQAVGTITNDDPNGGGNTPTLNIDYVSVVEGNSGTKTATFTVSLSEATTWAVTYDIATADLDATAGSDYVAKALTGQSIPAGQTSKTFAVTVNGDTTVEYNEDFHVNVTNVSGAYVGGGQGKCTIVGDDGTAVPTVSIGDVTVVEGNSGTKAATFTVSLSQATNHSVDFTIATANGTATAPGDYTSANFSQYIDMGATSRTFSVQVAGDTIVEPNETFTVNLSGVSGAITGDASGTVTITDDDSGGGGQPTLSIGDVSIAEGNSGTKTANFTVSLSAAAASPVSFDVASANGSATAGSDYVAASLVGQSIAAGQTSKTVSVTINGDTAVEADETFTVNVSNVSGATVGDGSATGTITNDDSSGGGAGLSIGDVTISEGNSGTKLATFTVSMPTPQLVPVFFDASTASGTATAGSDFVAKTVTGQRIVIGNTSKTVTVTIIGDTTSESDETFTVNLSNPAGGVPIADGQATGTITNDDSGAQVPTLSVGDVSISEGNSGTKTATFTVSLSAAAAGPVTYDIATSNGTATAGSDYVASSLAGQTLSAGQTSKTFSVTINGDTTVEGDESFTVNVSGVSGATVADGSATGTITNDDSTPLPTLSIADIGTLEGDSGWHFVSFVVTLSDSSPNATSFDVTTSDGTATAEIDYSTTTTHHEISSIAGEYFVMVPILGDTQAEGDETFTITLSNVVGATAPDPTATATILDDDIAVPFLSIADVSVNEGDAGTKTAVFTVSLSAPSTSPVSYNIATSGSGATEGEDYVERSLVGEVIPAGETSKTFAVTINGDTTDEGNEDYVVSVSNISGAQISNFGESEALGWILNDDSSARLSIDDVSVVERDIGQADMWFTVRLAAPVSHNVSFNIATSNGTATAGSDYQAKYENNRVIWAGDTESRFNISWTGDTSIEANETFNLTITSFDGTTIVKGVGIGTLLNDDLSSKPVMSIGDVSISEGDSGQKMANFVVSLSQASSAAASFEASTLDGTAVAGQDYWWTGSDWSTNTIPAGETSKIFSVPINGDTTGEPNETFTVSLSSVTGATVGDGTAVGTITNDDGVSGPNLSISDASIVEGNSGTKLMNFTVSLSAAASSDVSFDVATASGTALANQDYVHLGLLGQTIAAGQTSKTVSVTINGDSTVEPDEAFNINVSNVAGAFNADSQGVGTITNDDGAGGGAGLSIGDVSISEGNSGTKIATFTVSMPTPQSVPVFFDASTASGTATAGSDFVAKTLTGQRIVIGSTSKTFTVTINGDTASEADETFFVNLSNPVGGVPIADGQAVGTITNDDTVATPTLSIGDVSISEGNAGTQVATFTVSLSPAAAGTVSYDIATSNGTATAGSDYVASSLVGQQLTAGQTSKTFSVTINGDATVEPNETFTVTLSNVSGATLGDGSAVGTITNDDSAGGGGPTLSIGDVTISEGNSSTKLATFTVTMSAPQTVPVFFNATTSNGTATAGSDYVAKTVTDQRIIIGATTKTITVTISGDTTAEPNETFTVTLSNPVGGATIADGSAIGTITNDDAAALSVARFDAGGLVDDLDDGNKAPQVTQGEYALLLLDTATKLCQRTGTATIVGIDGVENAAVLRDLADTANASCATKPRYQAVMAEQGGTGFLVEGTADTDARGAMVLAAPTLDAKAGLTALSVQASGHERALTVLMPNALPVQTTARTAQLKALGQSVNSTLAADPQARLVLIGGVTVNPLRDLSSRDLPKTTGQTMPAERILLSPALLEEFGQSKVEFLPQAGKAATQVLRLQQ